MSSFILFLAAVRGMCVGCGQRVCGVVAVPVARLQWLVLLFWDCFFAVPPCQGGAPALRLADAVLVRINDTGKTLKHTQLKSVTFISNKAQEKNNVRVWKCDAAALFERQPPCPVTSLRVCRPGCGPISLRIVVQR